ncbi:MAG TPA: lipopolysaccharide transport periplasmic protein LptA [Deferrisomatales bacterium]|nr:lipopolysaccharide transport periplasmic protein LptA [Deferrisomatales bacterium]
MKTLSRAFGLLALGAVLATGTGASWAADLGQWTDGGKPIQIDSQSLEARADEGLVVFRGEVVARQGELTLQADEVAVQADPTTNEIRTVVARGSVRIQRQDLVATGQQAEFDVAGGVLTLSGEAKAWQGRNVVAGERITLHLADNRTVVEGARAVLYPGTQQLPR